MTQPHEVNLTTSEYVSYLNGLVANLQHRHMSLITEMHALASGCRSEGGSMVPLSRFADMVTDVLDCYDPFDTGQPADTPPPVFGGGDYSAV